MTLRHIGAALLFLVSFLIGYSFSQRYKKQGEAINMLHELLLHLQNEIIHSRTPLKDCFVQFHKFSSEDVKKRFLNGDFSGALELLDLKQNIKIAYLSFFERLGSGDLTQEKERLSATVEKSRKILEESEKNTAGKRRVATTLGFFIGSLLFLLLI